VFGTETVTGDPGAAATQPPTAPSTLTFACTTAFTPEPATVTVQETADAGAEDCQEPLVYGTGHDTTGAGGGVDATITFADDAVNDEYGPYKPVSSCARART